MTKCELLAPAGNIESLKIAADCGADAVYLGGSEFNARASAKNFDDEELKIAVDYCHLRKVKVYVTINIVIFDKEFKKLDSFIRKIYLLGVDAVIVQDIGVAMYIKKIAPNLRLHASTQMTVYDTEGAIFLKNLGFSRVVLARELSKEKIEEISKNSEIETEIFVHGAMCVCYSGQCLMSSMIGGRSGNRGKCAQPCRMKYKIGNKNGFLLSLKDMCLIKHLDEIKRANVTSLKIEGRMKGPEYVGTVVSMYRKYLENNEPVSDSDYNILKKIFFRGGFSDGYFTGKKGFDMFCHEKPDNPYLKQGEKPKLSEQYKKTKISFFVSAKPGEKFLLTATDEYGNFSSYKSENILEKANTPSSSDDKIKKSLNKLGDTVFEAESIETDSDRDVFLPVSLINDARRCVTSELSKKIRNSFRREVQNTNFCLNSQKKKASDKFELCVSVTNKEQLDAIRTTDCKIIYAPISLSNHFNGDETVILPRISPDSLCEELSEIKNERVLVRNIGQINIAKKLDKQIVLDHTMNITNMYSCETYKNAGINHITLSSEMMLSQIRPICEYFDCESLIYGKLPLMITENCMIKTSSGCTHGGYMYDRTGEKFLIKCLPGCRNEIYNSKPIVMSDKIKDLMSSGLKYGRIAFSDENYKQCIEIYNAYKNGEKINTEFTRGKFIKGV